MPRQTKKAYTAQVLGVSDVPTFQLDGDATRELSNVLSTYECVPSHGSDAFQAGFETSCARAVGEFQRWAANPTPSELKDKLRDAARHADELRWVLTELTDHLKGGNAAVALAPSLAAVSDDNLKALEALAADLTSASEKIAVSRGPQPQPYRYTLARDVMQLVVANNLPIEIGDERPEGQHKTFLCALFSAALSAVETELARINHQEIPQRVPDDVRPYLRNAADSR